MKRRPRTANRRRWPAIGAAIGLASGPAFGQGVELPETVVTASRGAEQWEEAMYSVAAIPEEEIFEQGYRTVPEALAHTPGVSVQKTTHGHGSPFVRGFTGRQNLLLVDGVRVNNSTWRGGPVQYWNTVDAFAIDRIELVKSQGSVLYGSDALGGTLNVLPRGSGFADEEPGPFLGGAGFHQFRTNGGSHLGRLETRFGEGGTWGVLLGVSAKDFGDIRDDALGRMRRTGYQEQNLDLKLEVRPDPGLKLTVAHQSLNQDNVWRWHSTVFNDRSWRGAATGTFPARIYDQERSLSYFRVEAAPDAGPVREWTATLSRQTARDGEFQDRGPADIRTAGIEVDTWGLDVQFRTAPAGGDLLWGLDYYYDGIEAAGTRTGKDPRSRRPVADDSAYGLGGVFVHYRRPVGERFELAGGARYTRAEVELGRLWDEGLGADTSARDSWDQVVFNLRGLWKPGGSWTVYGGASQGFRAPNVEDLSGNLTSRSGLESVGSLDLSPEESWTFELGSRRRDGELDAGVAVFHTLVDDLITSVPVTEGSGTVVSTNAQDARITGVELDAAWRFTAGWTLSGFLSWQEGTSETPASLGGPAAEQWVSRLSPLRGSLALRYDSPGGRWWAETRLTAAAKADKLSDGDRTDTQRIPPGGTPGYLVASLNGGWDPADDIALTVGLENLTDADYRIHGSGVNQPGFGAVLGGRVRF